jgi:lipoprotein-anchoring transpeptidase ErfK/SrfK
MKSISRRDFLKLGGLVLSSLAFTSFLPETVQFNDIELVRVAYRLGVSVYTEPDDQSQIVSTWPRDALVHVYETVNSGTPAYNPIWYRVFGGYMHRARLQKVRFHYNVPLATVPDNKLLGEVTVPYIQPLYYDSLNGWTRVPFRLYFSTIHWITSVESGPDGKAWYRLLDEADNGIYYVPAVQMRALPPEEIAPITPEVSNKLIDVNLRNQSLTCYENNSEIFKTSISSGLKYVYDTPVGQYNILVKLPSRRMSASDLAASDDENVLAGVPWCSFFTEVGHALHGTYWHDNFGVTMSHGCVNMRNEDAKWLFRWSRPTAAFDEIDKLTLDRKGFGTMVDVHN